MTIPIRGTAKGTPDLAYARAIQRGAQRAAFLHAYLTALYADAATLGIDADTLVAQWDLETDSGRSAYWVSDGNPAGIGAFDDGSNLGTKFTPELAARVHVTHMAAYLGITAPAEWIRLDPRWQAVADAGYVGTVTTIDDLGSGKWATDPQYSQKLRGRYVAYWGEPEQEPTMALKAYRFVGLDRDVWLPDDIDVQIKIITNERFRSFQKFSGQTKTTAHDTGSSGSNALNEWTWANNGRQGAGVGGYNFIVDDKRIIQCAPLDEVTWAAGTPEGNRTSWHTEQCFGGSINWDKSLRNTTALHGALCAAKGWSVDTALVKHQYWYGKWCPGQILNKGLWGAVVKTVSEAAVVARAAAGGNAGQGGQPAPTPVYPKPDPIAALDKISASDMVAPSYVIDPSSGVTCIFVGDRYQAKRNTPRRRYAFLKSESIGPDLKAGESFDVDWLLQNDEGWWAYTPYGTRLFLDDLVRVADVKGAAA
jgi:hypothetical protein